MVEWIIELIRGNGPLAYGVIFAMCFGESLAFVGLLCPGFAFMIAAGALVQSGALDPYMVVAMGALGATLGDFVSYWIGIRFKDRVAGWWPFTRHPEWLRTGHDFFNRHGGKSVFLGRFFGPVRAVIPLAAGMMEMPRRAFWVANIASAVLWAMIVTAQGAAVGWGLESIDFRDTRVQVALAAAVVLGGAGWWWWKRRKA